jgi:hypothetical protein
LYLRECRAEFSRNAGGTRADTLEREACDEVAKPERWNDEELKALAVRVVRAAPDELYANQMLACVLRGERGGRGGKQPAELREAATHYVRAGCGAVPGRGERKKGGKRRSFITLPRCPDTAGIPVIALGPLHLTGFP